MCGRYDVDFDELPEAIAEEWGLDVHGAETITMEDLGDLSARFNYELACDINARVPRIVCGGSIQIPAPADAG